MGSFKRSQAFDPRELEIIDLVFETAWEQIVAREPFRNAMQDEERREALQSGYLPSRVPAPLISKRSATRLSPG